MKPIRLSDHASQYEQRRGFTREEVAQAIENSPWEPAKQGRWECKKEFVFSQVWNGKLYQTKQLRPIFFEEADEIIVVTVYTYYY